MSIVKATFDGNAFVPQQPVDLAAGPEVEVVIPHTRKPTAEENRPWQEILQELATTSPVYPTVDDAMQQTRKRP